MNNQKLENKVRQDAANLKKDSSIFVGDVATRFGRFENDINQATGKARDDLTTWVESEVSHLSDRYESLTGEAREAINGAAATVKKNVGQGINQYNKKAQEVADKVPGGFSAKINKYPWVAFSIALLFGFFLGNILKPTRRTTLS